MNRCDTKVAYDTRWEAERASSISGYRWGEAMKYYRCGTHWHIAHKAKGLRNKHIKDNNSRRNRKEPI